MRKIVTSTGVALDGVTGAPEDWLFQFWSDELSKWTHDELLQSDALLLGTVDTGARLPEAPHAADARREAGWSVEGGCEPCFWPS